MYKRLANWPDFPGMIPKGSWAILLNVVGSKVRVPTIKRFAALGFGGFGVLEVQATTNMFQGQGLLGLILRGQSLR